MLLREKTYHKNNFKKNTSTHTLTTDFACRPSLKWGHFDNYWITWTSCLSSSTPSVVQEEEGFRAGINLDDSWDWVY